MVKDKSYGNSLPPVSNGRLHFFLLHLSVLCSTSFLDLL